MYTFNVLHEPWIPVVYKNGTQEELGILPLLEKAPEIEDITHASPLVECALYRLLVAFVQDALRLEEDEDIEDLMDEGAFDMSAFYDYVRMCETEGTSFNLFDEKRPFLQYISESHKDTSPIAKLIFELPSGNNHTHFVHHPNELVDYATAARLLPTYYTFTTMGGAGYGSSINGAPPYFAIVKGSSIFETLCHMMRAVDDVNDFDSIPVFWRNHAVIDNRYIAQASYLCGLMFPDRAIRLVPQEDGVAQIYFGPGWRFSGGANWHDPWVVYRLSTDGTPVSWKPNGARPVWRNLHDIVNMGGNMPQVLETCIRRNMTPGVFRVHLYGVQTAKSSYVGLYRHELELPSGIFVPDAFGVSKSVALGECITFAEKTSSILYKALGPISKGSGSKTYIVPKPVYDVSMQDFYNQCEKALWNLIRTDWTDNAAALLEWKETVINIGAEIITTVTKQITLPGRKWMDFYQKMVHWDKYCASNRKAINKLKKGDTHVTDK